MSYVERKPGARAVNVPNLLTGLRLLAVPVFVSLFLQGYHRAALAVFVGATVTDWFDGVLARMLKQFTRIGAILDPLADKALGLSALAVLAWGDKLPWWLVWITVFREACIFLAIWLLEFFGRPYVIRPTRFGKYATAAIAATTVLALVREAAPSLEALGPALIALTLVSAELIVVSWAHYLWMFVRLMRAPREPG
jgi:cardiolipin synthase (CMP-forming)